MTTFAQATLALARVVGDVIDGVADSGSTTTIVDAENITARSGSLINGTVWLLDCTQATIEGLLRVINKHDRNTITFEALAATITAADTFAILSGENFKKRHLEAAINLALTDLPEYTQYYEDASFITVANQEDYTIPAGKANLVSVEIAHATSTPFYYREHHGWKETADGKLRFVHHTPSVAGYRIRLGYNGPHAALAAVTDTLAPGINLARLSYEAAVWAWRKYIERVDELPADDQAPMYLNNAIALTAAQDTHKLKRESMAVITAGY